MGRGKAIHRNHVKSKLLTIRIDDDTKQDLQTFASQIGVSVSALVTAHIRHTLREQRVDFPLPGQRIPLTRIELAARRRRVRDEAINIKWSKLDSYDG